MHWSTIAYLNVVSIIMAKEHQDLFDGHAFVDCLCGKRSSELMRVDPSSIKLALQFLSNASTPPIYSLSCGALLDTKRASGLPIRVDR